MQKNPLLKKSKDFIRNLIVFIALLVVITAIFVLIVLSYLDIISLKGITVNLIFAALGLLLPSIKNAFESLFDSTPWETYLTFLRRKGEVSKNDLIRISYSPHLLIDVDGEYLLKMNAHGIAMYQLPAKTYPLTIEEDAALKLRYDVVKDDYISKYLDYRYLVPAKNLKGFYKEFCEKVDPSTYDHREIILDLVHLCSLDEALFADVRIVFKKRCPIKILFSPYTGYYEMIVRDVCLFIPNDEQLTALRALKRDPSPGIKFARPALIESRGADKVNGDLNADIAPYVAECIKEK